jgi:hypothetical protein
MVRVFLRAIFASILKQVNQISINHLQNIKKVYNIAI